MLSALKEGRLNRVSRTWSMLDVIGAGNGTAPVFWRTADFNLFNYAI
jgi:hypothetical protein